LCHFCSPLGRKPQIEQQKFSLSELSDKVFEVADDEGDGPESGVEELEEVEEVEGILRFMAERR
jgi:hypothetical protein